MIAATVLAAGDSVRMGSPKALLEYRGRTFLLAIIEKLVSVGVENNYVTLGSDVGKILYNSDLDGCKVVENTEPEAGPIGSVRSVLRILPERVESLLVWPVDQPHVLESTVRSVIDANTDKAIIVPMWNGRRGHPVRFKQEVFQEILQLGHGRTARDVVRADRNRVLHVEVEDRAITESINTPKDYSTLNSLED